MTYPDSTYTLEELNPYAEGSQVSYRCDPGFKMAGLEQTIHHVCVRTDEMTWEGPDVNCTGKICYVTKENAC